MEHQQVAERVVRAVGGPGNITAAAHCATRLRMVLRDYDKVDQEVLDNDPDLKGTFVGNGQYQAIVGPGDVDEVFKHFGPLGVKEASKEDLKDIAAQQGNLFSRFLKMLADIFVPLIPVLVGGGMLMALNNVFTAALPMLGGKTVIEAYPQWAGVSEIINLVASAAFAFLPVLVGFSATQRFGGTAYLGGTMGAIMVMPSLVSGYDVAKKLADGTMPHWDLFGLQVQQAGYQGTVLPILVIAWLLSVLEKFLHRHLKGTVDFIFTPTLTLLLTSAVTFLLLGPFLFQAGTWLGEGIEWLYEVAGPVGGIVFGFFYPLIVVTGLHQSFPPIEMTLWQVAGGSFIFAIASMSNVAQGSAALAAFLTTRNEKLKAVAGGSAFSAFLGITEPAVFGVNMRLRWPLYCGMAASAVGGGLVWLLGVKATALGAAGYLGVLSIKAGSWGRFMVALVITTLLSFAVSMVVGLRARRREEHQAAVESKADAMAAAAAGTAGTGAAGTAATGSTAASSDVVHEAGTGAAVELAAPMEGTVVELSAVSDPTFAQAMLGPGAAIDPSTGMLRAPVDGTVSVAFPTGHAVGLKTAEGLELLMHIGFDTVELDGKHFSPKVSKGDSVRAGDVLVEFDGEAIRAAGYDLTTPLVVTSTKKISGTSLARGVRSGQGVAVGDAFLEVRLK